MNAKLRVLGTIESSLNPEDVQAQSGPDYDFHLELQPEKDSLWDLLGSLNDQLMAI
jgi:hypothetical protein